jgi:hypothetical protein
MGEYAPKDWKSMEAIFCANEGVPNAAIVSLEANEVPYAFCLQAIADIKKGSEVIVTGTHCKVTVTDCKLTVTDCKQTVNWL